MLTNAYILFAKNDTFLISLIKSKELVFYRSISFSKLLQLTCKIVVIEQRGKWI